MRFEEILVAATGTTGIIWLVDYLVFKKARVANMGDTKIKDPVIVDYAKSFFPVLLLVLILRSFLIEPFRIPSGSMKPTLLEGDFILVNKFDYGLKLPVLGIKILNIGLPKRGDIVVFRHASSNKDLIKRVIGLPGDRVVYKDRNLYINGEKIKLEEKEKTHDIDTNGTVWPVIRKKEHLSETLSHDIFLRENFFMMKYPFDDVEVPEEHYFVLGDNRDGSQDGRFFGFVKEKDILGRAFATWFSWDPRLKDLRWSRIGRWIS